MLLCAAATYKINSDYLALSNHKEHFARLRADECVKVTPPFIRSNYEHLLNASDDDLAEIARAVITAYFREFIHKKSVNMGRWATHSELPSTDGKTSEGETLFDPLNMDIRGLLDSMAGRLKRINHEDHSRMQYMIQEVLFDLIDLAIGLGIDPFDRIRLYAHR